LATNISLIGSKFEIMCSKSQILPNSTSIPETITIVELATLERRMPADRRRQGRPGGEAEPFAIIHLIQRRILRSAAAGASECIRRIRLVPLMPSP
jgi:hypothetical protein